MKQTLLFLFISLFAFLDYAEAQSKKIVLVEQFANTRCIICARRNPQLVEVVDRYAGDVIHIKYHIGSPYPNCALYNLNKDENDSQRDRRGVQGSPTAVINGDRVPGTNPLLPEDRVIAATEESSEISLELIPGDGTVRAIVRRDGSGSASDFKIWLALSEDDVLFDAPNGEDVHYNVFRQFVSDPDGEDFVLNGSEIDLGMWDYMIDDSWNADNIRVVAWVEDIDGNYMNATTTDQTITSSETPEATGDLLSIYPNPAQSIVTVNLPSFTERISLYSVTGRKILSETVLPQSVKHLLDVTDLPRGSYILRADGQNERRTVRLLK